MPDAPIVPVRVARAWTTALAPNRRGGWNFITQTYEHGSGAPTEWVVLDLASGQQTVTEGPAGIYANSNYQIAEQLRAGNGRIFFPEADDQMAYYDPADSTVKSLGALGTGDPLVFRVVFGPDGQLYGGTQSNGLPAVFQLDPETLRHRVLGRVGRNRRGYSYAYYLAVDPPWVYAAVGQSPWELAALNTATGEMRILATRDDDGFLQLDPRPEGIRVTLISGLHTPRQVAEIKWCAGGALVAAPPEPRPETRSAAPAAAPAAPAAVPITPAAVPVAPAAVPARPVHAIAPLDNPLRGAPEIDTAEIDPGADGVGRVRWRTGAAAAWREVAFRVAHTSPVDIDALVALPDGTLLGSAAQYHGFFRYDPKDRSVQRFRSLGISGGPRAVLGGTTYFAGYPNGVLYAYDPSQPWTASREPRPDANPRYLGNFAAAGAHYAYFLEPSSDGRLYYAGRRERDGVGGGIGSYDIAARQFAGHHVQLDTLDPRGLVVLDELQRIVYSGRSTAAADAQLVVFDRELKERGRQTVIAGMRDTGQLFAAGARGVIVGVSAGDRVLYRHDVAAGKLLAQRALPGAVIAAIQRSSDRSIWVAVTGATAGGAGAAGTGGAAGSGAAGTGSAAAAGIALWRYDATTLDARRVRDLPGAPGATGVLLWQGARLFWATASELRDVTPAGE